MVYDSPFGIAGPKGMDPKIVAKLHDAFKKAIEDPAVIATLAKYDMVPNYKSTEDYKKFVVELTESERKVIDALGLAKKTNELSQRLIAERNRVSAAGSLPRFAAIVRTDEHIQASISAITQATIPNCGAG